MIGWELYVTAASALLALVFGLLARWERRRGNEDRALLGEAYDAIKTLDAQVARSLEALPTDSEFRNRLVRLRDRQNRVRNPEAKRRGADGDGSGGR